MAGYGDGVKSIVELHALCVRPLYVRTSAGGNGTTDLRGNAWDSPFSVIEAARGLR